MKRLKRKVGGADIFKVRKSRQKMSKPQNGTLAKVYELSTYKLLDRLKEIKAKQEAIKPLYDEEDEIIKELCRRDDVARHGAIIKDQFMGKNTVWRASPVRRYTVEWERDNE